MKTIHVISVSDYQYRAYFVEDPSIYFVSSVSAMDAVGNLVMIQKEVSPVIVLNLDNLGRK